MNDHRGLTVLEGGELLRACDGYRRIARNDLFGQPAHRFEPQRQRNHIEQQEIIRGAIPGKHVCLDCRAECYNLVGVEIVQRRLAKKRRDGHLHMRHARSAAHHHHAVNIRNGEFRVAQGFFYRLQGTLHQRCRHGMEILPRKFEPEFLTIG